MATKKNAHCVKRKPSSRGLLFLRVLGSTCLFLASFFISASAQKDPYIISQNDEAKLIFLRPQKLGVAQKGFEILSDFTVILKKSGNSDSVRMSFTLTASTPVFKWNCAEFRMTDTTFKCFIPTRIYQEKNHKKWDNRYEIMMPVRVFQKLILMQNDPRMVFSFDDLVVEARFSKKQSAALRDLSLQIQLDLNH